MTPGELTRVLEALQPFGVSIVSSSARTDGLGTYVNLRIALVNPRPVLPGSRVTITLDGTES